MRTRNQTNSYGSSTGKSRASPPVISESKSDGNVTSHSSLHGNGYPGKDKKKAMKLPGTERILGVSLEYLGECWGRPMEEFLKGYQLTKDIKQELNEILPYTNSGSWNEPHCDLYPDQAKIIDFLEVCNWREGWWLVQQEIPNNPREVLYREELEDVRALSEIETCLKQDPPVNLVAIHGPDGSGKSTLLTLALLLFMSKRRPVLWQATPTLLFSLDGDGIEIINKPSDMPFFEKNYLPRDQRPIVLIDDEVPSPWILSTVHTVIHVSPSRSDQSWKEEFKTHVAIPIKPWNQTDICIGFHLIWKKDLNQAQQKRFTNAHHYVGNSPGKLLECAQGAHKLQEFVDDITWDLKNCAPSELRSFVEAEYPHLLHRRDWMATAN